MSISSERVNNRVQDHVRRYQQSNGEVGQIWNGVPTLLLTTTGRRSGRSITAPLIYWREHDRYIVVASQGGAPSHPNWYLSLSDRPEVEVQVLAGRFLDLARTATAEKITGSMGNYDEDMARIR